jgi:hypothetical protein
MWAWGCGGIFVDALFTPDSIGFNHWDVAICFLCPDKFGDGLFITGAAGAAQREKLKEVSRCPRLGARQMVG